MPQPEPTLDYATCSPEERLARFAERFQEIQYRAAERLAQQATQPA